jgi:hypothetical protein
MYNKLLYSIRCNVLFIFYTQVGLAMFGYMTELDTVDAERTETITAQGSILTFEGFSQVRTQQGILGCIA